MLFFNLKIEFASISNTSLANSLILFIVITVISTSPNLKKLYNKYPTNAVSLQFLIKNSKFLPISIRKGFYMKTKIINHKEEIIDLSKMNIFEATKHIAIISSRQFSINPKTKIKYNVATPSIKNLLTDFSLSDMIEIV